MTKIQTSLSSTNENVLLELPDAMNREIRKGLREAGKVVVKRAKQLVPPPGYPGDKPELKSLRDTLAVEIKEGRVFYAVVGPKRPAGAHGHLVELGHRIVTHSGADTGGMAEAEPFMEPAAKGTKRAQERFLIESIKRADQLSG